ASEIIRRLQPQLSQVAGIMLYMQPVQDLTVESRVSRTQYQYTMEDAAAQELAIIASKLVDKLRTLPQMRDVASDQQTNGLKADLVIDRDTASRLGILPQAIDDTLYDAFGQRQVSTIFTQLNQYHIVLGVLYESYIHPITILSTLPSAGVGAILALLITGNDLGVVALIGIILLIGIVKKNAIMMIDFALEAERVEHKAPEEAIYQASLLRFRPIMMTTIAALLGGLPLAL